MHRRHTHIEADGTPNCYYKAETNFTQKLLFGTNLLQEEGLALKNGNGPAHRTFIPHHALARKMWRDNCAWFVFFFVKIIIFIWSLATSSIRSILRTKLKYHSRKSRSRFQGWHRISVHKMKTEKRMRTTHAQTQDTHTHTISPSPSLLLFDQKCNPKLSLKNI